MRPVPGAGDRLPDSVASLLAAFGAGDPQAAAACFSADAIWAPRSEKAGAVTPPPVHEGADEIGAALAGDPGLGHPHTVRVCLRSGTECLLEGDILEPSGAVSGSYGADFQLDDEGRISRALLFRIEPVEDNAGVSRENPSGVDIQARVDDYLAELEAARFENATKYFSDNCVYLHPPLSPGTPRVTYRGAAGMMEFFEHRGVQVWRHGTDASIQRGPFLMLEGHVFLDGTPEGRTGSYISSATVDEEGRILRYLAFSTAPMVPRR